ncbi:M48 family metallopeptidase [Patescibacteria group bacterium]|nr:M48 family metallopeptidase [Patescibacteria group bacterium]MBU3999821.1 M48 family metallopeptidase [Patescibacteria group bacterium]MBU4057002.1 M48 family metallopeptidase [Patescibacteria group bacterium]
MPTLYTQADKNIRNSYLLITAFLIFAIGVGWVFSQAMDSPGILVFAVIFSVIMSIGSYWWSDKIVLRMSKAKEIDHDSNRELYHIVENLCITAGLPLPKIYIIDDTAPNAFATGRDPDHAVIAVTTGILQKLEKSELEGVLAHELSHIGNRDILFSTIVVILVGFITLLADWFFRASFFGRHRGRDSGKMGGYIFIIAIILTILAPIIATLIKLAISRKREFLADASAALLTRYPDGLAMALEKISADKEPLEVANKATAHMYIVNPLKGNGNGRNWFSGLFSTHPPTADRVAALRGMG